MKKKINPNIENQCNRANYFSVHPTVVHLASSSCRMPYSRSSPHHRHSPRLACRLCVPAKPSQATLALVVPCLLPTCPCQAVASHPVLVTAPPCRLRSPRLACRPCIHNTMLKLLACLPSSIAWSSHAHGYLGGDILDSAESRRRRWRGHQHGLGGWRR